MVYLLNMLHEQLQFCIKNKFLLKFLINRNFPLTNYIENTGRTLYCPFHADSVTGKPSAQLYNDLDGITRLYCFSENKQYSTYDYIKLVLGKNPVSFLYNLQINDLEELYEDEVERLAKEQKEKNSKILNIKENTFTINDFFTKIYEPVFLKK